jgi:hypothetical protein
MSDLPKVKYLEDFFKVTGVKRDDNYDPYEGRTEEGYTTNAGAPCCYMLQIDNKGKWHRVYIWQISNNGTAFVKLRGQRYVVRTTNW